MIKMVESQRFYVCDNKRCAWEFPVYADVDRAYGIDEPKGCPQSGCNSFRCNPLPEKSVCRDCQELRLQEHATKLAVGSIPRSILVVLEDDLVDKCKAGDDVTITGVVRRRWKPLVRDRKMELELYILAKSIQITTKTSGKYSKRRSEHLEWSTVVDISIHPSLLFKPVSLSLSRSPLF